MNKLPNEIINQILLFNSHPVADLFKPIAKTVNEELYAIRYGFCCADTMSFADFFFRDRKRRILIRRFSHNLIL